MLSQSLLAVIIGFSTWLLWKFLKRRKEIPGPFNLPVVGYLLCYDKVKPNVQFCRLAKEYGNLFQIRLGQRHVVVVNGQKNIRELYTKCGANLGSPDWLTNRIRTKLFDNFIFAQFTPRYWIHKKILFKATEEYLRERSKDMAIAISKIVDMLVNEMTCKEFEGQIVDPIVLCRRSAIALIYYHCYGQLLDSLKHKEVEEVLKLLDSAESALEPIITCDLIPWLKWIKKNDIAKSTKAYEDFHDWHFRTAAPVVDGYSPDKPRSCLIHYLCHETSLISADDKSVLQPDRAMLVKTSCNVSMFGNFFTHAIFMTWVVLFMAHYPEIQQKVREEINRKLGGSKSNPRRPTPQDMDRLPYTAATFKEMFRFASPGVLGVPKRLTVDTELNGYVISKETTIFFNLYSANRDETVFTNPDTFDPNRFLTDDGYLDKKAMEKVIDAGMGPRRCGGIALMRFQMFSYFVHLVRSCEIQESADHPIDPSNYYFNVGAYPKPFKVIVNKL